MNCENSGSVTAKEDTPVLGDGPKKMLRVSRAGREALLVDFGKRGGLSRDKGLPYSECLG